METLNRSTRAKRQKSKTKYTSKFKRIITWLITVIVSFVFIFSCFHYFTSKISILNIDGAYSERAKVVEMGELTSDSYLTGGDSSYDSSVQYFTAKITSGEFKGQEVLAAQTSDNLLGDNNEKRVKVGDYVILYNYGTGEGDAEWIFGGYSRLDSMVIVGLLFCICLIIFGQVKGLNTIVSLAFTCLAVFAVFLPAVISGANIYLWTIIICIYVIPMTLLITEGPTIKALTTILGCVSGVLCAGILERIMDGAMKLTGMMDEHSVYLTYFDPPINLHGIIFAMVVIGGMGAVMDVAMDISSSLHELHVKLPDLSVKEMIKSGFTIGRDVMGTMANTLVLAYIGSNLCSILLMLSYSSNLRELLNREGIIVEMMNGLVGSFAILLTIPLTSLICAIIYSNNGGVKLFKKQPYSILRETKPDDDFE